MDRGRSRQPANRNC